MENGRTPQTRYAIDCDHAALVITDCQNDFLSPGESIVNNGAYRADTTNPIESAVARSRERRFEAMIRTYSADLYRLGYWLCHDPVLAEDLKCQGLMRVISVIEDQEVIKTILKHLGLWLVTRKPEPRAKGPPRESQIDYSDVQISPAGEYLCRDPE